MWPVQLACLWIHSAPYSKVMDTYQHCSEILKTSRMFFVYQSGYGAYIPLEYMTNLYEYE
jgi:hypothetical protein